jgi:hypothetical protein
VDCGAEGIGTGKEGGEEGAVNEWAMLGGCAEHEDGGGETLMKKGGDPRSDYVR